MKIVRACSTALITPTHRQYVLDSIGNMPMQYDLFTPVEIKSAIEGLKGNKASGTDNVFAEHLK